MFYTTSLYKTNSYLLRVDCSISWSLFSTTKKPYWKPQCNIIKSYNIFANFFSTLIYLLFHFHTETRYAWALDKPSIAKAGAKAKEKVGTNFGVPHRDITYKNCHSPVDGSPDILSLWIPVVDVDTDNGCMYVIPRERDPQFSKVKYNLIMNSNPCYQAHHLYFF